MSTKWPDLFAFCIFTPKGNTEISAWEIGCLGNNTWCQDNMFLYASNQKKSKVTWVCACLSFMRLECVSI